MGVTIVAVYLKTESGDGYLFLYDDVVDPEEFVQLVEDDLGEELAYVTDYEVTFRHSRFAQHDFEHALSTRIFELGDE